MVLGNFQEACYLLPVVVFFTLCFMFDLLDVSVQGEGVSCLLSFTFCMVNIMLQPKLSLLLDPIMQIIDWGTLESQSMEKVAFL